MRRPPKKWVEGEREQNKPRVPRQLRSRKTIFAENPTPVTKGGERYLRTSGPLETRRNGHRHRTPSRLDEMNRRVALVPGRSGPRPFAQLQADAVRRRRGGASRQPPVGPGSSSLEELGNIGHAI